MQTTMHDLTVILEDRPGTLAKAAETIAGEAINIEGAAGVECGGEGVFHVLFKSESDATRAKKALDKAGFKTREQRPVAVIDAKDAPGEAAKLYRLIANAEINVDLTYIATNTRIVIGSADPQKVAELFKSSAAVGASR